MHRGIVYFFGGGFKNIWRNKLMSAASAGIIAASLILLGVFLLAEIDINAVLDGIEEQCEINVYIADDAGGSSINRIYDSLCKIDGVKEVNFMSKEERIELARQTIYKGREYLLDDFDNENPLRDSYILISDDLGKSSEIAAKASEIAGVDEVINLKETVDKIKTFSGTVRTVGGWVMTVLVLIAMFIVINTVKLGLIYRRKEINIMRFVGASNGYIRGPFMAEGFILGMIGALIAAVPVLFGYSAFVQKADGILGLSFINLPTVGDVWGLVLICFLCIGAGIGLLGSGISIRKYLKV